VVGHYSDDRATGFAKDVDFTVIGLMPFVKRLFTDRAHEHDVLFVNVVIEHFGPSLWDLVCGKSDFTALWGLFIEV
jgi:hypothetical protein